MSSAEITVELRPDRFSSEGVCAVVRGAPDWFGPLLRGTIMGSVATLALDSYEERFRECHDSTPHALWHRIQLLPLVAGYPVRVPRAVVSLRASNRLFTCSVSRGAAHGITLAFRTLAAVDVAWDPEPFVRVGARFSIDASSGPTLVATPTPGPWTVEACDEDSVRYSASAEDSRLDVERWRAGLRVPQALHLLQRVVWRLREPAGPAQPTVWEGVTPRPSEWEATRNGDRRVVFRRVSRAEIERDDEELLAALHGLGGASVAQTPAGLDLRPGGAGAFVHLGEDQDAETAFTVAGDAADTLAGRTWTLRAGPEGAVRFAASAPRSDVAWVRATDLHVEPPEARPPDGSDASWERITLCALRRGEAVRGRAVARLGTGATGARWAPCCGGVPVVRPAAHPDGWSRAALASPEDLRAIPCDRSAWLARVEPSGSLTAEEVLRAAAAAICDSLSAIAESIHGAYDDDPPRQIFSSFGADEGGV